MEYIFLTFFSGIISGIISAFFRYYELKRNILYMGWQLIIQVIFFVGVGFIFMNYYGNYYLDFKYFKMSWIWIYLILNTLGYFSFQIFYEWKTGNKLIGVEKK